MWKSIIILALTVAVLSLTTTGIVYYRYIKMRRKKDRHIVQVIHEKDRVMRELENIRTEKETMERVLTTALAKSAETLTELTENST